MVLVGNKCNLEGKRIVRKEVGQTLAHSWDSTFFETSAKQKVNVNEVSVDLFSSVFLITHTFYLRFTLIRLVSFHA